MDCVFCKIVENAIPANIVYKDPEFLVFKDINPHAPIHLLLIPREHLVQPVEGKLTQKRAVMLGKLFVLAFKVAKLVGIEKKGWRLVQNNGSDAHQVVEHFHIHLMGGGKLKV